MRDRHDITLMNDRLYAASPTQDRPISQPLAFRDPDYMTPDADMILGPERELFGNEPDPSLKTAKLIGLLTRLQCPSVTHCSTTGPGMRINNATFSAVK